MSLTCALLATSLHQWARRYIRLTQPARCSPEKRARMRAFFADGVEKMHVPWAVEGLPTLLHLSLFLFFFGLVIFLFNTNHEVFISVVWWIGFFSIAYVLLTLLPLIRHDSPYCGPLSTPAWILYASMKYVTVKVFDFMALHKSSRLEAEIRYSSSIHRYRGWMLGGVEKAAEERALERSSEIDAHILDWTLSALGDDDSLEDFFEAVPGFFNSKLVKYLERNLPETLLNKFWDAMDGFMGHTLSSNLVVESVKSRRIDICGDIMSMIPCTKRFMHNNLRFPFDQAPVSIERVQAMARWFAHVSSDVCRIVRFTVAKNLARIQERDDRWIALASNVYGLSEHDLRNDVALGGDNVLLATLINLSRRSVHSDQLDLIRSLSSQFDIHNTLPGLQHDFCTLWNEIVQEAKNSEPDPTPAIILDLIRHHFIALHQGTDGVPIAFSSGTVDPSSYPSCNIPSHRPGLTTGVPVPDSRAVLRSTQPASMITGSPSPSDPATTTEIREASQVLIADPSFTSPIYFGSSRLMFASASASPRPTGIHNGVYTTTAATKTGNRNIPMKVFRQDGIN